MATLAAASGPPAPHRKQHRFVLPPTVLPPGGYKPSGLPIDGGAPFGVHGSSGAHPAAALRAAQRALHAGTSAAVDSLEALLAATDSRLGASMATLATGGAVEGGKLRRDLLGRVKTVVSVGERLRFLW